MYHIPPPLFGQHLFAVGHGQVVEIVGAADDDLVFVLQGVGDVEGGIGVAAGVAAYVGAVHEAAEALIRGINVQQHPIPAEALRQGEAAAIPQGQPLGEMIADAGKPALHAEGDADLLFVSFGIFPTGGKVPPTVQVYITFATHLGTGIDLPGGIVDLLPPGGQ